MKNHSSFRKRGFTLLETVIAIGVLAVLLTGFMIVFAPAAAGIKKAISVQEADRLASTLEQELVTLRKGEEPTDFLTGFDKAFNRIKNSTGPNPTGSKDTGNPDEALLVYQYRGSLTKNRQDGTPEPVADVRDAIPGQDYIVQTMMRTKKESNFLKDLVAVEGGVYVVKCVQLVFEGSELQSVDAKDTKLRGNIMNPKPKSSGSTDYQAGPFGKSEDYPEAVIAFSAEFFVLPSKSAGYFSNSSKGFKDTYTKLKKPVFTRNLAVRR